MKPLHELLSDLGACDDAPPDNAVAWSRPYGTDYERAWRECERGDWLLWIASRLEFDRKLIVRAGCACARGALECVPEGEERPRLAIETAERWCDGDASIDEVRAAGNAAWAAGNAATRAAAYAAWAAWAAEAAEAAGAACAAAWAAGAAWAAARARAASLRRSAELVREIIDWEIVQQAAGDRGLL